MPFKDPSVGSIDIALNQLLDKCENNKRTFHTPFFLLAVIFMYRADAKLELVSKGGGANHSSRGFITIRLSTGSVAQMGALALSNARQDIEHRRIMQPGAAIQPRSVQPTGAPGGDSSQPKDFATALGNVVSKLDQFVNIMDRTSKVSAQESSIYTADLEYMVAGPTVRQPCLASDVFTVQGT
jgi:hypothetical protein